MNLTIHCNRFIYLVEPSPEALKLRGKEVDVDETFDGQVLLRVEGLDLRSVPFNPEGGVRQQDIDDNKYLATTLAKIRQDQLARDEEKLTSLKTLRGASSRRPSPPADRARTRHFYLVLNPTFLLWFDTRALVGRRELLAWPLVSSLAFTLGLPSAGTTFVKQGM